MADNYVVVIILTDVGFDAGPFDVYYSTDNGISYTQISNDIPASAFTGSGYFITNLPDAAETIKLVSEGVCSNEIITPVIGYPDITTTTTTCDTSVCTGTCCLYSVEVNQAGDLAFTDCDGNSPASLTAFSSFTICYNQSTGFLIAPDAETPVIIDCDCIGYNQPTIEYSVEICNTDLEYSIEFAISPFDTIYYTSISGTPYYCAETTATTVFAGGQLIIDISLSALTNDFNIEIFNNNVLTFSDSLVAFETFQYRNNFSMNDNWFIRIYDT